MPTSTSWATSLATPEWIDSRREGNWLELRPMPGVSGRWRTTDCCATVRRAHSTGAMIALVREYDELRSGYPYTAAHRRAQQAPQVFEHGAALRLQLAPRGLDPDFTSCRCARPDATSRCSRRRSALRGRGPHRLRGEHSPAPRRRREANPASASLQHLAHGDRIPAEIAAERRIRPLR